MKIWLNISKFNYHAAESVEGVGNVGDVFFLGQIVGLKQISFVQSIFKECLLKPMREIGHNIR